MTKNINFYFDFSSPYSYIGYKEIINLEKKNKTFNVNFMPVFLGGLHSSAGVTPAAFISIKSKYMIRDTKLVSEKKNIKFIFNSYFPIKTVNLMKTTVFATFSAHTASQRRSHFRIKPLKKQVPNPNSYFHIQNHRIVSKLSPK